MDKRISVALAGDVMLGRTVDAVVRRVGDPAWVWGDTLDLFRKADFSIINLECVIAKQASGSKWVPKVFHFKALPWAIEALQAASIEAVALANNHVLDFKEEALLEMITLLDKAGISYSGAGSSLSSAVQPAVVEFQGIKVSLVATTDNEPGWEATKNRAGIFYVPLTTGGVRFERLVRAIKKAKAGSNMVVVSTHVGPHMREAPGEEYISFARSIIDAGADVYMGTSNHSFQGVELYHDKIILYDLGDFVDDYAVDPQKRNDWSFLFLLEFQGSLFASLSMVPTRISKMQVNLARGRERDLIMSRMERLCRDLGTKTRRVKGRLKISLK